MVVVSPKAAGAGEFRRSIYLYTRRSFDLTLLNVFDEPVLDTNCPRRTESAVVSQSLTMLNDDFVLDQAGLIADRVSAATTDHARQIETAFRLVLSRPPTAKDADWSQDILARLERSYAGRKGAEKLALSSFCQALLNTNEFLYVK